MAKQLRTTLGCLFLLQASSALALSTAPDVASYSIKNAISGKSIGSTQSCLKGTTMYSSTAKQGQKLASTDSIFNNAIFATNQDSRCLLKLKNGDKITLGNNTTIKINQSGNNHTLTLWSGSVITNITKKHKWSVLTNLGDATLSTGKFALKSRYQWEADLVSYKSNAKWSSPEASLKGGYILKVREGKTEQLPLNKKIKQIIQQKLSPEHPLVVEALNNFNSNKLKQAKASFTQVQKDFPNNAEAAYYLGAMALKNKQNKTVVKQWEKYAKLEPKKAAERDVIRNLTVIKNKLTNDQVKKMVNNESFYSNEPPEPGTVAVMPFANKGSKKYNIISKGITAMVITDLSKVPGLKVLEREKIQKIIDEIKLSQSGLVDGETAVKAGKIMRAEKMVEGSYSISK